MERDIHKHERVKDLIALTKYYYEIGDRKFEETGCQINQVRCASTN